MNNKHWYSPRWVVRYFTGYLSPRKQRNMENHLKECSRCRKALDKEREFFGKISGADYLVAPSLEFQQRLRARVLALPPLSLPQKPSIYEKLWNKIIIPVPVFRYAWIILVLVFLSVVGVITVQQLQSRLIPVRVTERMGTGVTRLNRSTGQWEILDIVSKLQPGDRIQTDGFTRMAMKLGYAGKVWINRSSDITVLANESTALAMDQGMIYIALDHLKKPFRVETPSGVIYVLGTDFQITVDNQKRTIVSCIENKVFLSNAFGEVAVEKGYQSIAEIGKSPTQPKPVDIQPFIQWKDQFARFAELSPHEINQLISQYMTKANELYHARSYQRALEHYRMSVYLDPRYAGAYYGVGRSYRTMGEYENATTAFYYAIQFDPTFIASYYQLAMSLIELHQYSETDNVLKQAIKVRPDTHVAYVLMGSNYIHKGDLDNAQRSFQEAIRNGADVCQECNPELYAGMAEIARQQKDWITAEWAINKIILDPNTPLPDYVYLEIAGVYRELDHPSQEKAIWRLYLKYYPKGEYIQEANQRLLVLNPKI